MIGKLAAMVLVSAMSCGLIAEDKAETKKEQKSETKKELTFLDVRNASLSPEKAESINSAKLVYSVSGKKLPKSFLMIRAKKFDKFRLDALKGDELFSAARDGDSFWIYNKKDGSIAMPQKDTANFAHFTGFLHVPFIKGEMFSKPTFVEDKEVNGVMRSCYEVYTLDDGALYTMWIEKKSRLLKKLEIVTGNEESIVTFYHDYRTVNGIKVPGSISTTNENGTFTLTLIAADWNIELTDSIFQKGTRIEDNHVALLMKIPAVAEAKAEKQKKAKDQKKVDELEAKIGRLKIEITAAEKELNTLANISKSDRENAASVSKTTGSSSYGYYWDGNGWTGHNSSDRAASRDSRNRSHVIDDMRKENQKVTSAYQKKSKKLVELQIQLDEAERQLKKLTE